MKRLLFAFAVVLGACSSDQAPLIVVGEWGGTNAQMDATSSGTGFQFKCGARGALSVPLRLDAEGRFDEAGTYDPALVAGGPRPAVFRGEVRGTRMTLDVNVDQAVLGPFELMRDQPARFDVCNF